jgi:hypothetical protein
MLMNPDKSKITRISWKSLAEYLLEQFNLERGLGYTVKQLLIRPQKAIQEYLFEDRHRMVKPLGFLLLVVAIAAYLSSFLLAFDSDIAQLLMQDPFFQKLPEDIRNVFARFFKLSQQYFNLFLMSNIPATTLATYLLFRDRQLNFPEHLVINVYIFSIQTLLILPLIPFMVQIPAISFLLLAINIGYFYYALTQIFNQNWKEGALKTLVVFMLAQFIQGIVMVVVLGAVALVTYLV